MATQRDDGTWDEPYYTGTGFPGDFYINYHLYRLVFPISALGRLDAVTVVARPAAGRRPGRSGARRTGHGRRTFACGTGTPS